MGTTFRDLARTILVISGIWPPDVGGPATHAPEAARFLTSRGHTVRAVTMAAGRIEAQLFEVRTLRRDVSLARRLIQGTAVLGLAARNVDVIYAIGMFSRSALASVATRTPLVLKLPSDPAFERARARGLFSGTLEEFQIAPAGPQIRALRMLRRAALARASTIIVPSRYLAQIAESWQGPARRIAVIPNPGPSPVSLDSRQSLRSRFAIEGPTFVFAGRLVIQKNLRLVLEALTTVHRATLVLIGDGPELRPLQELVTQAGLSARVRFQPPTTQARVLEWVHAADAAVLPSAWENFPHSLVEAYSVSTPVIATAVGGVPEIVEDQVSGLLIPPGDVGALADAMRSIAADKDLRSKLSAGAKAASGRYAPKPVFEAIERVIEEAVSA